MPENWHKGLAQSYFYLKNYNTKWEFEKYKFNSANMLQEFFINTNAAVKGTVCRTDKRHGKKKYRED